jgi:hypothetical protein
MLSRTRGNWDGPSPFKFLKLRNFKIFCVLQCVLSSWHLFRGRAWSSVFCYDPFVSCQNIYFNQFILMFSSASSCHNEMLKAKIFQIIFTMMLLWCAMNFFIFWKITMNLRRKNEKYAPHPGSTHTLSLAPPLARPSFARPWYSFYLIWYHRSGPPTLMGMGVPAPSWRGHKQLGCPARDSWVQ